MKLELHCITSQVITYRDGDFDWHDSAEIIDWHDFADFFTGKTLAKIFTPQNLILIFIRLEVTQVLAELLL